MNIVEIIRRFEGQEDCIAHLENLRFDRKPYCPLCESHNVAKKREKGRVGRWNCHSCGSSFSVLSGTIFAGTRTPLIKWFLAIALVVNARKGISSYQLSRHLGISQDNAWRMLHKIRQEMMEELTGLTLKGIVEADETYASIYTGEEQNRGRGSNKLKILGAVERQGNVMARRMADVSGNAIKRFMKAYLEFEDSVLITDKWLGYKALDKLVEHLVMEEKKEQGKTTSVIEGFWATVKRSLYGIYHHYQWYNADLYLAEICFRYNNRKYEDEDTIDYFMKRCVFKHSNIAYHTMKDAWML